VLLWFLGTALVSVWYVFSDPFFDYRLLLLGALVPDLVDVPFGQARWAHSLTVAVGMLALVMIITAGRRPVRRLLLGLPIGMLLHLVWDGAFASTKVFWWPFSGAGAMCRCPRSTVSRSTSPWNSPARGSSGGRGELRSRRRRSAGRFGARVCSASVECLTGARAAPGETRSNAGECRATPAGPR
jgi:hypothetical protein